MTEPGPLWQAGRGIGRAAVMIGVITVLARVVGFGRQLVFAHTVSHTCLGTAYATANQVPNIIYDIVLGGALTGAVVPLLAGPAARRASPGGDPEAAGEASQTASALLTWTVLLLVPVSAVIAVVAGPLVSVLLSGSPGCGQAATAAVSTRMLAVFAPQILLYGLAVVLYGILQAHRRFAAPALAPVLSSVVVMAAYVAFVPLGGGYQNRPAALPEPAELMLSVGTTAGVAALALTALVPALRLRLRLRPALRFPAGVARRARGLAAVGVAALVAQDAAVVAVIVLANGQGGRGALVLYNYAWQMFFLPYAVLAVPIVTSAFPVLSAREGGSFEAVAASSTRAVTLVSWLGAALLAGAAWPAARLFNPGAGVHELAFAFTAFAPGLVGFGLATHLSRVLLAQGRSRAAGTGLVAGWLVVIAADVIAVPLVPARWVVPALGLGNTVGLLLAGLALLAAVGRPDGRAALRGVARASGAGVAGALAGGAAGAAVAMNLPAHGFFPNACVAALACGCVLAGFGLVVLVLDGADLRAVAARLRH
ncbi:MAG: virulence factor MviN, partial [Nocardiopsaceae bacterium]|nr:virulence factor MviN [Nocardiopsaceae bacterium]